MGNYVLYLIGLNLLSPGTAQLVVQMGPVLLLVASVFVFKRALQPGAGHWPAGAAGGFGLFFNQRLEELLTSLGTYTTGVLTILLATSIWVFYALSQKQLLTVWHSQRVMMVIYLSCAAADALGAPAGGPAIEPGAGLAAAGLLPEHPGGLRRLCRSAGALGGLAGERDAGADTLVTFVAVALAALVGRSTCMPRTSMRWAMWGR
jgi:drug/metabolite transporter (DMT)-like permease